MFALGPDLTAPANHSHVPVPLPWGSTPEPPGPAILAPTNLGPDLSAPPKPGPSAAPTALTPPGPHQRVASPQCHGDTPPWAAAPTPGTAMDSLVAQATSTLEQISKAVNILTYFRPAQEPTVPVLPWPAGHPETALLDY